MFLSKIQTATIYSKCDFILEDNVTFQVSETGNWHKESNVKIIIHEYESDDSSDILLNEKVNYKQHNQHTKMVSDF